MARKLDNLFRADLIYPIWYIRSQKLALFEELKKNYIDFFELSLLKLSPVTK